MESGKTDKIKHTEEASFDSGLTGGTPVTFGYTQSFDWQGDAHVNQHYALESDDSTPISNTDGVHTFQGSHTWNLNDGRELVALFGTLTDDDVGNFTLALAQRLPSYTVQMLEDDNGGSSQTYLQAQGLKYTDATVTFQNGDEPVTVSSNWLCKKIVDSTSFTPAPPTTDPFMFNDGYFEVGGVEWEIQSVDFEITRNVTAQRFSKNLTTADKNYITDLVEGVVAIAYTGVAKAKRKVIEEQWGGTTPQPSRTDKTLTLNLENSTNTLVLNQTGGRQATINRTLSKDQEVVVAEFSGVALGMTGSGTYTP